MAALVIVCLALLGGLGACLATRPATDRTRSGGLTRRAKVVARNPQQVNSGDIAAHLVRDGVSRADALLITEKAREQGIKPFVMWLWLQQFDARALAIVVAADLTPRELITHIAAGTVPDLAELEVFAALNGLTVAGPRVERRPVVTVEVAPTAQAAPPVAQPAQPELPPVYGPGSSEFGSDPIAPLPSTAPERDLPRLPRAGGDLAA